MSAKRGNRYKTHYAEARVIDPDRIWFVVQTKPAQDLKAVEKLTEAGVDVWLPVYQTIVTRRGKKREVTHRFFANYLFAGLARDARGHLPYRDILGCEHVLDILGRDEHGPVSFPTGLLQTLADRLSGQSEDRTEKGRRKAEAAKFELGAFHKVIGGPFSSFMAEVVEVLDSGRVRADVEMFGRKTPVEFEPGDLAA